MKWILLIPVVFAACNNTTPVETKTVKAENVSAATTLLDSAKTIAFQIISYVEQCDSGAITKKQLNKKAGPLQKRLDSMRLALNAQQITELDNYRSALVSGMIDRKMARKNRK